MLAVKGVKEGGAICLVALHPTHQISRLQTFHAHLFTKCSQSPSEVLPQHASAMFLWKQVLYLATTPWRSVPELWLPLHKTLKTRILAKYKQRSCQTFHNFQHSLLLTVPPCPVQLWLSQTIKSRSSFHLFLPPGWQLRGFWKTQCFEGSPVWSRPLIRDVAKKKNGKMWEFFPSQGPPPPPCLGTQCLWEKKIMVYFAF